MLDWGGCVYEWVGPGDTCLPYRPGDEENVGDKEEEGKACTNCKHPSQTNHKFCEMCGRKLTLANEEEKDRPGDATTKEAYSLDKPPELKSGAGDRWQEAYSLAEGKSAWRNRMQEDPQKKS